MIANIKALKESDDKIYNKAGAKHEGQSLMMCNDSLPQPCEQFNVELTLCVCVCVCVCQ